ncbi:hypothetical protein P7K49_022934, partial [Saguinus oedipus]
DVALWEQPKSLKGSVGSSCSVWGRGQPEDGVLVGAQPTRHPAHLPSASAHSISNKELSELIEQLQKNADQVEKNIVDTEAKMQS